MDRRQGVTAMLALVVAGCATSRIASTPPPPPPPPAHMAATPRSSPPPAAHVWARCPPNTACAPKEKSPHRQYYDAHHRRYYYYDPLARRYFWEDGSPKV